MDFETKYPKSLRPHRFEPPHLEIEFEPLIKWTGRVFSCGICGKLTGFHIANSNAGFPSTPCCSDECKIVALENEAQEDPSFTINFSPSSSEGERLHDSQEAAGSSPASGTTLWEQTLLYMIGRT